MGGVQKLQNLPKVNNLLLGFSPKEIRLAPGEGDSNPNLIVTEQESSRVEVILLEPSMVLFLFLNIKSGEVWLVFYFQYAVMFEKGDKWL